MKYALTSLTLLALPIAASAHHSRAEFSDEVNGVAAPILDASGAPVGALTVYGPAYRFPGDQPVDSVNAAVADAAARLAAHLDDD